MRDFALVFLILLQLWIRSLIKVTTPQMSLHMSFFFFFFFPETKINLSKEGYQDIGLCSSSN